MTWNLALAILPVLFSFFLFRKINKVFKAVIFILWFLFLPNTVYVVTDVIHLIRQWEYFDGVGRMILLFQYGIFVFIGLTCFVVAFAPWERILQQFFRSDKQIVGSLIALNFLMGFALVIGRFERVNSWDVFANPMFVVTSSIQVLLSYQMLGLIILFGLFSNFFYFLFREKAKVIHLK